MFVKLGAHDAEPLSAQSLVFVFVFSIKPVKFVFNYSNKWLNDLYYCLVILLNMHTINKVRDFNFMQSFIWMYVLKKLSCINGQVFDPYWITRF